MGIIGYLISLLIVGFVVGGLGRLIVPGPNPIGAWRTLGVGLIGAFVGSLIGGLLGIGLFTVVFEVAVAAGLVYLVSGRSRRLTSRNSSSCSVGLMRMKRSSFQASINRAGAPCGEINALMSRLVSRMRRTGRRRD